MSATPEHRFDPIENPWTFGPPAVRPEWRAWAVGGALIGVALAVGALDLASGGQPGAVALRTAMLAVAAAVAAVWFSGEIRRLSEAEERYALIAAAADTGIWDWDLINDRLFMSARTQELVGLEPSPECVRPWAEWQTRQHYHPDDWPRRQAAMRDHLEGRTPCYEGEWRIRQQDGTYRWIHSRGVCTRDGSGRAIRFAGSMIDIDARKRMAEALKRSEERYALVVTASGEGYWDWIVPTDEFHTSPRLLELYGFPPDTVFSGRADFFDRFPFHPDDRPKWERAVAAHFAGESARFEIEIRMVPRGGIRWIHLTGLCSRDASGAVVRWTGSVSDVTERKRASEALRRTEERFALAVDGSTDGIWDWDLPTGLMFFSERTQALHGLEPGPTVRPRSEWRALFRLHPDDADRQLRAVDDYLAGRAPSYDGEYRVRQRDGGYRWVRMRGMCLRDEAGRAVRMAGSISDIHSTRSSAAALRESEERFALAVAGSNDGIWDWDVVSDNMFLSARAQRIYGLEPGVTVRPRAQWRAMVVLHPEDVEPQRRAVEDYLAGTNDHYEGEWRVRDADGSYRWVRIRGQCVRDAERRVTRFAGSVSDVDTRKRAESALRESEERYALAMGASEEGHFDWNVESDDVFISEPMKRLFGIPADEQAQKRTAFVARACYHPDDLARIRETYETVRASGAGRIEFEYRIVPRPGEVRWLRSRWNILRNPQGEPERIIGVVTDVTERRRIEDELRSRQEMLDLAQKAARAVAFEWRIGAGEGQNRWSPGLEAMYGIAPGSYDGSFESWKKLVHPDDWPAVEAAIERASEAGDVAAEYRVVHRDGSVHWLQAKGRMFFDSEGRPARMVGFMLEVTERRQAEDELRRLERQLRQSQRLEAMGTLAGGIAHDFNNILGAILGYGEMALRDAASGTRLRRDIESIMTAGERGRALVDRILAFSRSGVGERVVVHVEKVVREALNHLAGRLPEGVRIEPELGAGRAAVMGDPTQVHQVLMNLATNAVQAMPAGGRVRVRLETLRLDAPRIATTGTVGAGDYLLLEVADTGTGIAPEIVERIFDPFFTTKEVGVGTGLGLSLVHGIVTELGGAVEVASAPGAGSVFTVYLPRAGDAPENAAPDEPATPRGARQQVLIVDDEEPLVRLATETLADLGYAAVGFTSSAAALEAFRADPDRFDAVITDERMPGLSGSALIREMRGIRSAVPILLVSGFVGAAVLQRAGEAGADDVLKKPLSARELATSLARVLRPRSVSVG